MTWLLILSMMITSGMKPEKQLTIKADEMNGMYRINDIVLAEDSIYVLDSGNGRILVFNRKGVVERTISDMGEDDGKLYNPSSLCLMNSGELWITDTDNGRISVFRDEKFVKNITVPGIDKPAGLIAVGDNIVVSNLSKTSKSGFIVILNRHGRVIKNVDCSVSVSPGIDSFWNANSLVSVSDHSFVVGFKFYNSVKRVNLQGSVETINMEKFYSYSKKRFKGNLYIPEDFCAMTFTAGPDGNLLIINCDIRKKRCLRMSRFDFDNCSMEKVQEFKAESSVMKLRYFKDKRTLAVIYGNDVIELYRY